MTVLECILNYCFTIKIVLLIKALISPPHFYPSITSSVYHLDFCNDSILSLTKFLKMFYTSSPSFDDGFGIVLPIYSLQIWPYW